MVDKDFRALTVKYGARIDHIPTNIVVSLPYDPNKDGSSSPPTIDGKAIWDTGASSTVITKSLARKLGLKPTGISQVTNTSGSELKNTFFINLYLPMGVAISYVKATECDSLVGDFDVLIGMDIIGGGDFAVTHADGKTTMSFRYPSIETIDYAKEAQDIRKQREVKEKFIQLKKRRESHLDRHKLKQKRAKTKKLKKLKSKQRRH